MKFTQEWKGRGIKNEGIFIKEPLFLPLKQLKIFQQEQIYLNIFFQGKTIFGVFFFIIS